MNLNHSDRPAKTRSLRERGQIIIMVGLATIVMFGIVGLAVDIGRLYVTRVELGRSVDAAALSGILEFNGTQAGLDAAELKAEEYFDDNEPDGIVTRVAWANPDANEMTMDATKTINMIFLSVLGIKTATVSAHAKAGFGTQFLDAVMVLDATPSMAGNPITQAKAAATTFKNILLGNNPQGNVSVGVTAFRGCFKPNPASSTPHSDCIPESTWTTGLTSTHATLNTVITAIQGGGANTATNVCTGLAKGWEILAGAGNHNDDDAYPGNKQYMVILSDGDNAYWGTNTYSGTLNDPDSTPQGTTVGADDFPCQPIDASSGSTGTPCPAPWNDPSISSTYPCYKGLYEPLTTVALDRFPSACNNSNNGSNGWGAGSGWASTPWTRTGSGSNAPQLTSSDNPTDTSCHARLRGNGTICRSVDLSGATNASMTLSAKRSNNWETSDRAYVEVSTISCDDGFDGNILLTYSSNGSGGTTQLTTSHVASPTLDLTPYVNQTVYIRFRSANATDEYFFVDTVTVSKGLNGSPNGYLNGNDGSNPGTCNEYPRPRERQIDARTIKLAQAIKAQGVEIFVVAFSGDIDGCNLNSKSGPNAGVIYNDEDPAECNAVNQTDGPAIPGVANVNGPIGDDTHDGSANYRLLMCMASNTEDSDDHYFYAETASELQAIFTAIANQIAHRLIE